MILSILPKGGGCKDVYLFDAIAVAEFDFENFPGSSEILYS